MNKKRRTQKSAFCARAIFSLLLVILITAALSSCAMIRKTSEGGAEHASKETTTPDTAPADTEDAGDKSNTVETGIRYSEDQAYDVLIHSFTDYDAEQIKVERTGNIIAESDGTEYYIFKVSLPIIPETEEKSDAESGDDTDAEDTTEAKPVEMAPPVEYYVSVNGVVHSEVSHDNVDTDYVKAAFGKNYGDRDEDTGYAYRLDYEGLLKDGDNLCYNFAVYRVNDSGAEPVDEYAFNFIVTVDGKLAAKEIFEH